MVGNNEITFSAFPSQDYLDQPRMSLFKEVGDNREEEAVLAVVL